MQKRLLNKLKLLYRYLGFMINAKNEHSIHSPFVFSFYTQVIKSKNKPNFKEIEALRNMLLKDTTEICINDLGEGSKSTASNYRSIRQIAKNSLKPKPIAQLLSRIVSFQKPNKILELGTSLGITTLYLANGFADSETTTVEGCSNIQKKAMEGFKNINQKNIKSVCANFDEYLPTFIKKNPKIDFFFLDGNHSYDATKTYFNLCLNSIYKQSIMIIDDIYWSSGMKKAWEEIINHKQVNVSINLFHFGILFFDDSLTQKHYKLRF